MQQPSPQNPFFSDEESNIDLKHEVLRYLRYWPWFLVSLLLFSFACYFYLRYAPKIYQTSTKIKILNEGKGLELPSSAFVFNRTNINLENEIEILTSYRILEQVASDLNLTSIFLEEGKIQTTQRVHLPFKYEQTIPVDSITKSMAYKIVATKTGFEITDMTTNYSLTVANHDTYAIDHKLPFQNKVENKAQLKDALNKTFILKLVPLKNAVLGLKASINIEPIGENSHLLQLSMKGESPERSELILNAVVAVFNMDGVNDRQQVSKRTLDFIDDRFMFLAQELDSIEVDKKDFKQDNNLVYLEADSQIRMEQRQQSEEEVFRVENQLAVSQLIMDALKGGSSQSELLPANVGIENGNVNSLIQDYNTAVLEKDKLVSSGGINNPAVLLLNSRLSDLRGNINGSLNSYKQQLSLSQQQLKARNNRFKGEVSRLPEKEKLLRAIERQQKIKESLYLFLLQKREEASINLAITEPAVKVVEHALSGSLPISPKRNVFYAGSILAGLLIPFGILYLLFMLDTKLHGKKDIEQFTSTIPVAGEIPSIKAKDNLVFSNPNDRTGLAESFRILSSNVKYMLPQDDTAKVIFCTSSIKGEGKTFVSLNLSLSLSSLNKKVLIIGADLRNPQLHSYMNIDKKEAGLSNYLHNPEKDWKQSLIKGFEKHPNHDTLISGSLPPNPAYLLTNGRFEALLEEAKTLYDYIIVDTAPTILVTDTLLISQLADATLYIVRADFTEKNLLGHSVELYKNKKLKNLAFVINSVGNSGKYDYNYGHKYGYHES
ncbi:GumC family protein [Algibacter sp.]|uniref:GumC family protein n=1 Tax=Algibacter sp. TaxID=1872428 RepID=UPI003C72579E